MCLVSEAITRRNMIVELVGLPGGGKSTFARRLVEDGEWKIVNVSGRTELVFYNALFLLGHPILFTQGLIWFCRYRGSRELWYMKFMNLFLVHNAKYMKAQIKAKEYPRAIIDQGHHQNAISLFDTRVADDLIDHYVKILPKPDLLCFFLADEETRTKRLAGRGYGAREEWKEDERESWENARELHFERLYLSRRVLSCATEVVSPQDEVQKLGKITHMRPWYFVLHGRMPTEKAHGLQIAQTMEALIEKDVYTTLWIPRRGNTLTLDVGFYYDLRTTVPVRVFSVPNFLLLPRFFGQLRFWLDAFGFFLTLAFTRVDREGVYYTRNPELAWLFTLKGASVWYEAHLFPASKAWLLKFFLAHVDGIMANSEGTARAFVEHGFQNVHVVRNGVDIERFFSAPEREEARTLLGLPPDKTIVMYVGAFYAWKGVPLLLEAWRQHFAERDDLSLVLVGGSENDLMKNGGLEAYRSLENVLLVDHASLGKVPVYLSAADILMLPNIPSSAESVHYTSPIKLFEYMASGRPIVAADLPSIREVLSEETAIVFTAGDTEALARGIAHALRSPREAGQIGEQARKRVGAYSWSARAQLLLNIARGGSVSRVNTHMQFAKTVALGLFAAMYYLFFVYAFTEFVGFSYPISVALAHVCVLVINFFLLKRVFVGGAQKTLHEFSRFVLLTFANFVVNEFVTYVLVEKLGVWYMLAQVLIVGALAIVNFFAYRSSIFQTSRSKGN